MIALVLGGFLGPIVVIAAVLLGGSALRAVDRLGRRLPPGRRRVVGVRSQPHGGCTPTRHHLIAMGQAARLDERGRR